MEFETKILSKSIQEMLYNSDKFNFFIRIK